MLYHNFFVDNICPESWTYFNKYCYKYFDQSLNYRTAELACQNLGAHLPSIHSDEENKLLQLLASSVTLHTGLQATNSFTHYWSDETSFDYQKLKNSHFDPNEHCLYIESSSGQWVYVGCSSLWRYVCKKKAGGKN